MLPSRRSPGEKENVNHSSILYWNLRTESLVGCSPKEEGTAKVTEQAHTLTNIKLMGSETKRSAFIFKDYLAIF